MACALSNICVCAVCTTSLIHSAPFCCVCAWFILGGGGWCMSAPWCHDFALNQKPIVLWLAMLHATHVMPRLICAFAWVPFSCWPCCVGCVCVHAHTLTSPQNSTPQKMFFVTKKNQVNCRWCEYLQNITPNLRLSHMCPCQMGAHLCTHFLENMLWPKLLAPLTS